MFYLVIPPTLDIMNSIVAAGLSRSGAGESVRSVMQHDDTPDIQGREEAKNEIRHGKVTKKSESINLCFAHMGNERKERLYKSNIREPLGKAYTRGYTLPSVNHEYGVRRLTSKNNMKDILFPQEQEQVFRKEITHEENTSFNTAPLADSARVGSDGHSVAEAFDWKVHVPEHVSDRWKAYHAATENVVGRHRG